MPTREEYEAAGLLRDPLADEADRLALLDWLAEQGYSIAEMVAFHAHDRLYAMASDATRIIGKPAGLNELATAAGVSVEDATEAVRALGLPPEGRLLPSEAAALLHEFAVARRVFSEEAVLHFARVIGSSLDRIAEAAGALFRLNVEAPMLSEQPSELALARIGRASIASLDTVTESLGPVLRAHFLLAVERTREADRMRDADSDADEEPVAMAIGFVDLVGFTPVSSSAPARELLDLLLAFERHAHELVQAHGGRVVKLIGDEVMFAAVDPGDACRIADGLFREFAGRTDLTPRAGIAWGDVLAHGGDYFGGVVNIASRIADIAVPWEILLAPEVAVRVPAGYRAEPAGRRLLKGFADPVPLSSLVAPAF